MAEADGDGVSFKRAAWVVCIAALLAVVFYEWRIGYIIPPWDKYVLEAPGKLKKLFVNSNPALASVSVWWFVLSVILGFLGGVRIVGLVIDIRSHEGFDKAKALFAFVVIGLIVAGVIVIAIPNVILMTDWWHLSIVVTFGLLAVICVKDLSE